MSSASSPDSRVVDRVPRRVRAGLSVATVAAVVVSACTMTPRAGSSAARRSTTTTTTSQPTTTTTADPGLLPQTDELPSSGTAQFQAAMAGLWAGVQTGSPEPARAAFFPESAYLQVKTVADPAADYQDRLVAEFDADLAAAHALLGAGAPSATLVDVEVPSQYAHWVPPGVCANRVGYFEVGHSRVVYREDGVVRSFGIASLISWRGAWYVVHLGAVVRSGTGGTVDDPEPGPGTSPPSSSC